MLTDEKKLLILAGCAVGFVGLVIFGLHDNRRILSLQSPAANTVASPTVALAPVSSSVSGSAGAGQVLGASTGTSPSSVYVNPFRSAVSTALVSSPVQNSGDNLLAPVVEATSRARPVLYVRGFVYPIAELGNCSSGADCFQYCQSSANLAVCANFSQRHGYMPNGPVPRVLAAIDPGSQPYLINSSADDSFPGLGTNSIPGLCNNTSDCLQKCQSQTSPSNACLNLEQNLGFIDPNLRQLAQNSQVPSTTGTPGVNNGSQPQITGDQLQQQQQAASANYNICLKGAAGGSTSPLPITDIQNNATTASTQQCQAQYQQVIQAIPLPTAQQSKQNALDGINSLQQCFAGLKDFAAGYSQCLAQSAQ